MNVKKTLTRILLNCSIVSLLRLKKNNLTGQAMQQWSNCKSCKGFTLLELLIAMAVLGILITGIITFINPITQLRRARDAERKNTLFQLRSALELFYNDNNGYPSTGGAWFSSEPGDVVSNNGGLWIPGLAPIYIRILPRDPEGGAGDLALHATECDTPNKRSYRYRSDGQNYALLAHCSMIPNSWDSKYGLFDLNRPTWAWKVCAGTEGCINF